MNIFYHLQSRFLFLLFSWRLYLSDPDSSSSQYINLSLLFLPCFSFEQQTQMLQRNSKVIIPPAPKQMYFPIKLYRLKRFCNSSQQKQRGFPLFTSANLQIRLELGSEFTHQSEHCKSDSKSPIAPKMVISGSVRLALIQFYELLAPVWLRLQLELMYAFQAGVQVVLKEAVVLSNAQAQACLQNIAFDTLQMLLAQLITTLLELLHCPLKKISLRKKRLVPRPKKITINTITNTWNAQTTFGFYLHIPQTPWAAVPMTETPTPNMIPKIVYSTLVFPKKMLLLKKRKMVRARMAKPSTIKKIAPMVVKHLAINIVQQLFVCQI